MKGIDRVALIGCFSVLNFRAQMSANQRHLCNATSLSKEHFRSYFKRLLHEEGVELVTMTAQLERT